MRNCWTGRDSSTEISHIIRLGEVSTNSKKRCNCNDLNSMFEIVAGELRAKLLGRRGLTGLQDNAPSNISDQAPLVWRAPKGPAAVPVGGGGA